ncbi:MAG: hypothetical protein ASARMPREDX12_009207 [Alectoria sarmentosa]|nr:MAG: hypothetical protein ASARMPREDX12_009207 [Alectoria sarmentosa]
MGIPRLALHLQPYASSTVVGCQTPNCERHKVQDGRQSNRIIIDGPSFAYCIFNRLFVRKPVSLDPMKMMPSYDEVGKGALAFLEQLESYGLVIEKIYFDGYLPMRKRDIRIQRLNDSLKNLKKYLVRNGDGSKKVPEEPYDSCPTPSHVFEAGSPTPITFRGMIASPFLVPAVLDAISCSKYAKVSVVVPGEADVYCAEAARNGGIVLTNDSDLFVHDLGSHGTFSLIHQAELRPVEEKGGQIACQTVRLSVFRPKEIAERLGLVDLRRLAYVFLRTREGLTLPEAIIRANEPRDIGTLSFQEFLEEYATETSITESQTFSPNSLATYLAYAPPLDPRVSELILQLTATSQDTVYMYLPYLIDDPSRSSAWLVSTKQRSFAYSIPNQLRDGPQKRPRTIIAECHRRGDRILAQQILLPSPDDLRVQSGELLAKVQDFVETFADYPDHVIWRAYALADVYRWYLDNGKPPPSRETMTRLMTGLSKPGSTWEDIHLSAQVQAVLYTLRMTQQILRYTMSTTTTKMGPSKPLKKLASIFDTLPPMAQLVPSGLELAARMSSIANQTCGLDLDDLLDLLAVRLQKEVDAEEVL